MSFEVAAGRDVRPARPQRLGQVHPAQVRRRHAAPVVGPDHHPRPPGRPARAGRRLPPRPHRAGRTSTSTARSSASRRPRSTRIFDDIVEFAELSDFIDQQVKHYSSGMYARLGFAVAINVEPEILLVDEVLSVGDEAFQRKCIDRVRAAPARRPHDPARVPRRRAGPPDRRPRRGARPRPPGRRGRARRGHPHAPRDARPPRHRPAGRGRGRRRRRRRRPSGPIRRRSPCRPSSSTSRWRITKVAGRVPRPRGPLPAAQPADAPADRLRGHRAHHRHLLRLRDPGHARAT